MPYSKRVQNSAPVTEEWRIEVANPSPYERTDYVEVDLARLGVPDSLDEGDLWLVRRWPDGNEQEIPYQIDCVFGAGAGKRVLTFSSERTPKGPEDYSQPSAEFILRKGIPERFDPHPSIRIGHYYKTAMSDESENGFNWVWDKARPVNGVKLFNDCLEAYFSLVPNSGPLAGIDYTGSATSIEVAPDRKILDHGGLPNPQSLIDALQPFSFERSPDSRWGQLTELAFFPTPWDVRWFERVSLLNQEYELVWSKSGQVRAICTLRSQPMTIRYKGAPFFEPKEVEVKCHLYRVFYIYPEKSFYGEELFLRTAEGHSLSFRPYYSSHIPLTSPNVTRQVSRFEHIPDYFAIWLYYGPLFFEYGFASDAHTRWLTIDGDEIRWRLPHTHHHKNTHLFMLKNSKVERIEPFHDIGHIGWYERVFKPLEAYPLADKYPLPRP